VCSSDLEEARTLAERGARELILIAQDTTRYGLDLYGKRRLSELLTALCRIESLDWLRLHYLYPDEMDVTLMDVIASEDKIVKYLDIPIQHINDKLLHSMNRRGTRKDIETLFQTLRARIPHVVLRTSLIVGLPGEGEAEFEELCDFLRATRLERAGVFAYSPEEGTPAAEMPLQVPEDIKKRRAEIVTGLQAEIMDDFNKTLLGQTIHVLTEGFDRRSGVHVGRSWADSPDVDGKVYFTSRRRIPVGTMTRVHITGAADGYPLGEARRQQ
jgi:ribosomal protein S12 methylthiotransferase